MKHIPFLLATGLVGLSAVSAQGASPPIRTANTRQVAPGPTPLNALPPAPIPSAPTPLGIAPDAAPAPGLRSPPAPPVPSPDGGSVPYPQYPLGTMTGEKSLPPRVYLGDPDGQGSYYTPTDAIPPMQPVPVLDPNAPMAATDRFGVSPPPGTLGHTYHRRTRLTDDKKHPRVGIVEVHLSENYDVSAKGLKSKWTGKVWELESDPLLPGVPHIFEVKAEWGAEGSRRKEVRTIRLIMGRIVELEF